MTVYITGSSGFVGQAISNWLELKEYEVVRLNRDSIHKLNIKAKPGSHALVHCAWAGVLGKERNSAVQEQNLQLCEKILELADYLNICRLIAFGSQAEYGRPNHKVDETAPLEPTTRYGEIKIACQELLHKGCIKKNIQCIWLRLFDPYGPGDRPEWFLPYVIQSALMNRSPELTECTQAWDYIYIYDVCRCVDLILSKQMNLSLSGSYNLSSNEPIILRDLIGMIFEKIKPPTARPLYGYRPFRDDQVYHLQGCNKKLEINFGWTPQTNINKGLDMTINYERNLFNHSS